MAYQDGFTVYDVINGQYFFGWGMLFLLVMMLARKKVSLRTGLLLATVGTTASLTGIFYGISLETVTASLAVVLLFQFTWIGIVINSVLKKRLPKREEWISLLLLLAGTIMSSGIIQEGWSHLSLKGTFFGMLAAVTFSFFIYVNGSVAVGENPLIRSFYMMTGAMIILWILFKPSFFYNGAIQAGLWKYGLALGLLGIIFPAICFSIGVPRVGPYMATILGAIELPTAIVSSVVVLKETVSIFQWLGIVLILAGIVIPQAVWINNPRGVLESGEKYD